MASNVSRPVPCSASSGELAYIVSNTPADRLSGTRKSRKFATATALFFPCSALGSSGPMLTARSGDAFPASCPIARFNHPSRVTLIPGVPDSIKSCASKCDRVGSGDPTASIIAKFRASYIGFNGASAGCSPKKPSNSTAASGPLPGRGTAIEGRIW